MTNFEVFHLMMKHCVECLILEVEIKNAKMSRFSSDFQNTHLTLISFVFSL